jgi:hypothetical protein
VEISPTDVNVARTRDLSTLSIFSNHSEFYAVATMVDVKRGHRLSKAPALADN